MNAARAALVVLLSCAAACGSSRSERGDADAPSSACRSRVEKGGRTAAAGAKTGAKTGVEGVKTFGRSVGGLFEDGSDGAKREWKKGAQQTKKTAREGAAEVDDEASTPRCK